MALKYIPDHLIFQIYQTTPPNTDPNNYTQQFIKTAIQEKLKKTQPCKK